MNGFLVQGFGEFVTPDRDAVHDSVWGDAGELLVTRARPNPVVENYTIGANGTNLVFLKHLDRDTNRLPRLATGN